jgi:long-chain fatty acid transport protein
MRKLLKSNSIKKIFLLNGFIIIFILILSPSAYAVNGDILIGIGPISRSLGGTGIAAPQDPISAVFANPAAMCFSPYCPRSEFNLISTVFMPSTRAAVEVQNMFRIEAKSKSNLFLIPAVGISSPLNQKWRFGFAAYGISGMGVDYRYRLDINPSDPGFQGDIFTKYAALKAAPNIAYMFNDNFSVGASIHINYATLDLGDDNSDSIGIGLQIGSIYKTSFFRFGFSYISPQKLNHKKVSDFDMDSIKDDLKLYIPQIARFGVAFEPTKKSFVRSKHKMDKLERCKRI